MSDETTNDGITFQTQQEVLASNTPENALKKFYSTCTTVGTFGAKGQDALPMLFEATLHAANNGLIGLKDKPGKGQPRSTEPDDAQKIFAAYSKGYAKQVHVGASLKAQESKLRCPIKMGLISAFDPIEVFESAKRIHKEMSKAEVPVKPAYAAYLDVARTQCEAANCGSPLTDDQLREVMAKPEAEEKTLEQVLKGMIKTTDKLIAGGFQEIGMEQSEEIIQVKDLLERRLAALIRSEKIAQAKATLQLLAA
jgi:hypothetical protein